MDHFLASIETVPVFSGLLLCRRHEKENTVHCVYFAIIDPKNGNGKKYVGLFHKKKTMSHFVKIKELRLLLTLTLSYMHSHCSVLVLTAHGGSDTVSYSSVLFSVPYHYNNASSHQDDEA